MTISLTTKISTFIQKMKESEEQTKIGFKVLLQRDDFVEFFDLLYDAGIFSPENAPGPKQADQKGSFWIPYWSALDYLYAVARVANNTQAKKIVGIIQNVSCFRDEQESRRDNYHTYRKFAEILALIPSEFVNKEHLEKLLPIWLGSRFDRGLVCSALDKGLLTKYTESQDKEDHQKAVVVINELMQMNPNFNGTPDGYRRETIIKVDSYFLREIFKHHANNIGQKIGEEAVPLMLSALTDLFDSLNGLKNRSGWTYLIRPAVEEHEQNLPWKAAENAFVEGFSDALLGWVDSDTNSAASFIETTLEQGSEIARRVCIFVLNKRWDRLQGLFLRVLDTALFDTGNLHELYVLLQNRFESFSDKEKRQIFEAIQRIPAPDESDNSEYLKKYFQCRWLSAIVRKGYSPVDSWFDDLICKDKIGLPEHPELHFYMESFDDPGSSPYSVLELKDFAAAGVIVDQLNSFEEGDNWRGPTVRSLVDSLEDAIKESPNLFLDRLDDFMSAGRSYQYGVLNAFLDLWCKPREEKTLLDWDRVWGNLVSFCEFILNDESFWDETIPDKPSLTPTRDWIPPLIAQLIDSGTAKDDKSFPEYLLNRTWRLLQILLYNLQPGEMSPGDTDAVNFAINSSRGKTIKALFKHILRECRISDLAKDEHKDVWEEKQAVFQSEIEKCKNDNFEFSTLAAMYLLNIKYMDQNWLEDNLLKIFPIEKSEYIRNLECALEGLAFAPGSPVIYELICKKGVVDYALSNCGEGYHAREKLLERIALAYLQGNEALDSPRFEFLFREGNQEDLITISSWLGGVSQENLGPKYVERILSYWEKCVEWGQQQSSIPTELFSSLSLLSCYINKIGDFERDLLMAVAPYVDINFNFHEFIEQLNSLIEGAPADVCLIFGKVLEGKKPIHDYNDNLKNLIRGLAACGQYRHQAMRFADELRYIPGMREVFDEIRLAKKPSEP